jgi:hypothetical protein
MTRFKLAWIGAKMAFINVVIVAGAVVIVFVQWQEATKNSGFGSGGYNQGIAGTIFLAVLLAGIPIILWGVVAYLGLSWLLLRHGEKEQWEAHRLMRGLRVKSLETPKLLPTQEPSQPRRKPAD